MTASPFASEYDLDSRRAVRPRGRDFELVITPRYQEHYLVQTYEALTADLLRSLIRPRRLFVDVGAHSGFFTLLAATTNPDLHVVALEPVSESHQLLCEGIERNGVAGRVEALCAAASAGRGEGQLFISEASDNCSFYRHPATATLGSRQVPTVSLDALLVGRAGVDTSVAVFAHSSGLAGAERSLLSNVTALVEDHGAVCTVVLPGDGPLRARLEPLGVATVVSSVAHWWCDLQPVSEQEAHARMTASVKALVSEVLPAVSAAGPDVIESMTLVTPWGTVAAALLDRPHVWQICEYGERDHRFRFFAPFAAVCEAIAEHAELLLPVSNGVRDALFPHVLASGGSGSLPGFRRRRHAVRPDGRRRGLCCPGRGALVHARRCHRPRGQGHAPPAGSGVRQDARFRGSTVDGDRARTRPHRRETIRVLAGAAGPRAHAGPRSGGGSGRAGGRGTARRDERGRPRARIALRRGSRAAGPDDRRHAQNARRAVPVGLSMHGHGRGA